MVNEFTGLEFSPDQNCPAAGNAKVSGMVVLKDFEMEDAEVWEDLVALGAWAIFYQAVFYIILKVKYRTRIA